MSTSKRRPAADREAVPDRVKTTIVLPRELWKRVKVRAMDEGTDLNGVVIAALENYLGSRRREG